MSAVEAQEPSVEKIEEGANSDSDDEEVPALEGNTPSGRPISKAEKNSRKAIEKLGLKAVTGVTRVSLRKGKQVFVIQNPDIFKSPTAEVYVVFGDATGSDASYQQQAQLQQLQQLLAQSNLAGMGAEKKPAAAAAAVEAEVEGEVDESGLDAKDIELVVQQASVSRAKAVKALKENNSDIVATIMALTA